MLTRLTRLQPSCSDVTVTITSAPTTTSTCSRSSADACPTTFNPCCAYICAEAQVPFALCSPEDDTRDFASCSKCPGPTAPPTTTTTIPTVTSYFNTTTTSPSPTSSVDTATCSRSSINACPTAYNPCCAYICAEAQVPFDVCSPEDDSGQFASCSKCPGPTVTPTQTPTLTTTSTTTPTLTSSFITSTCSRRRIVDCPTAYNPCCAYVCAEAQLPFNVCSPGDETGESASCTKCPSPTPTS